jgi:hypothetical protein
MLLDARSHRHVIVMLCSHYTKIRARDSLNKAIKAITSPKKAKYIRDN